MEAGSSPIISAVSRPIGDPWRSMLRPATPKTQTVRPAGQTQRARYPTQRTGQAMAAHHSLDTAAAAAMIATAPTPPHTTGGAGTRRLPDSVRWTWLGRAADRPCQRSLHGHAHHP